MFARRFFTSVRYGPPRPAGSDVPSHPISRLKRKGGRKGTAPRPTELSRAETRGRGGDGCAYLLATSFSTSTTAAAEYIMQRAPVLAAGGWPRERYLYAGNFFIILSIFAGCADK